MFVWGGSHYVTSGLCDNGDRHLRVQYVDVILRLPARVRVHRAPPGGQMSTLIHDKGATGEDGFKGDRCNDRVVHDSDDSSESETIPQVHLSFRDMYALRVCRHDDDVL